MATAGVDWLRLVDRSLGGEAERRSVLTELDALDASRLVAGDPEATDRDGVRDRFVTLGVRFGISTDWHRDVRAWGEDRAVAALQRLADPTPAPATVSRWATGSWGWTHGQAHDLALRAWPDKAPPVSVALVGDVRELLVRVAEGRRLRSADRNVARRLLGFRSER
jgi:hypothetical protein